VAHSRHYSWFSSPFVNSFALLSDDPGVNAAVVFVHGFLGDPHDTFYAFQDMVMSHPTAQTFWSKRDLFFFTYPSFRNGIETSARSLLDFLTLIFSKAADSLSSITRSASVPPSLRFLDLPARTYSGLVMVGHSEGGMVIRKAAVIAETAPNPISKAKVVLFAPAISGVNPAGFKGMLLQLSPANWVALPFLSKSLAYRDMNSAEFRNDVKSDTLEARKNHAEHSALWAKLVFGSKEDVVEPVKWPGDDHLPEEVGQNHISICKPTSKYDTPITLIAKTEARAKE
jgi:pimeloyl-ACP methyl ester carboxylesterase